MSGPSKITHRALPVLVVGLLALVLAGSFSALRSHRFGGVHAFVLAGTDYVDPAHANPEIKPLFAGGGYDGQFVYRLSYAPFTGQSTGQGIRLDTPSYRQGRILLPVAAWATHAVLPISRGTAIELVNVLAVGLAGIGGALVARALGRHELWGLVIGAQPGVLAGVARDINEPLAWALLLVGIAFWMRHRWWCASAFFVLAVLARETTLFVMAGIGLAVLLRIWRQRAISRDLGTQLAALLAAPLALGVWELYLKFRWHQLPSTHSGTSFGTPALGVAHSIWNGIERPSSYFTAVASTQHLWTIERIVLLAVILAAAFLLVQSRLDLVVKSACVPPLLAALSLHSWANDLQFQRAALEASGTATILLLASDRRWAKGLALAVGAMAVALVHEFVSVP